MHSAEGQNFSLSYCGGYCTYQLKDIKQFQTDLLPYYTIPVKIIEKFPDYYFNLIQLEYGINSMSYFGITWNNLSTGGRNHVSDYSGEYKLDLMLKAHKIGIYFRHNIIQKEKFEMYAGLKSGFIFSEFEIDETFRINNVDTLHSNDIFTSKTFFGEPFTGIKFYPKKRLALCLNLGYEWNIESELKSGEDDKQLRNIRNKIIFLDWSGIRISGGVSVLLYSFKK